MPKGNISKTRNFYWHNWEVIPVMFNLLVVQAVTVLNIDADSLLFVTERNFQTNQKSGWKLIFFYSLTLVMGEIT